MPTICPDCHHPPSGRESAYGYEPCGCKCHDVADAAPQLLAACKLALDECSIFFRTDGELMSALADAVDLAENSADCS